MKMKNKYDSMLPSGDSQMQGGNSETGGRQESFMAIINVRRSMTRRSLSVA